MFFDTFVIILSVVVVPRAFEQIRSLRHHIDNVYVKCVQPLLAGRKGTKKI